MPGKLIILLVAAGAVGAAAVAGTVMMLNSGSKALDSEAVPGSAISVSDIAAPSAVIAEAMAAETVNPDDFGAAPDWDQVSSAPVSAGSRWGFGKEKLPPPKASAGCITREAMDEAMLGTGCDCSCDGYAVEVAGSGARQCRLACGMAWYACWAPDPTDAELDAHVQSSYESYKPEVRAVMEAAMRERLADPETRSGFRAGLMLGRATAWDEARMCGAD